MTECRTAACCWVMVLLVAASAGAQETRIKVVQPGAKFLKSDLKGIVSLTTNKGLQKEWKNLEDTIDSFLVGIDPNQPIRIDFTIGADASGNPGIANLPCFPILKMDGKNGFLENIDTLGYKAKKKPPQKDFYEITQPGNKTAKPMFVRHVHKYAMIGQNEKDVPATLPDPVLAVKHLLTPGVDLAAEMKNEASGAAQRKKEFEGLRKELEAAIKFKRNEDKAEFELRKLGATQMFEEAERFVVESELFTLAWTTADGAKSGTGDLKLTALPETSLLDSIRILSASPSYFANVQLHPKPVLTGKWLFPLDPLRKEQAKARHPVFRAATKVKLDKREALTDSGKTAAKQALDKLVDIFDASLDIGFDGFVDTYQDDHGKHTGVIAMRCGKAKLADDIVELLPKIRDDWKVKLNSVTHADVTIHELTVPPRRKKEFESLFSGNPVLYVGTSDKAVWAACGKDALQDLKDAIDQQAKPAPEQPDPDFASGTMQFGLWLKLLDVLRANEPKDNAKKTKQEIQQDKERDRLRQLAIEAFEKGDDVLTAKLTREGDDVVGKLTITEGVFRFIGSAIADFSKTNLR